MSEIHSCPALRALSSIVKVILIGCACYFGSRVGQILSFAPDHIAVFWPPNAITLAAIVTARDLRWWAYLLAGIAGNVAADIQFGSTWPLVLGFAVANGIEIIVAATLLWRALPLSKNPLRFNSLHEILVFFTVIIVAAMVGGCIATGELAIIQPQLTTWIDWRTWWFGDALGYLTITPALLLWGLGGAVRLQGRRAVEAIVLTLALVGCSVFVFGRTTPTGDPLAALLYLPFPLLMWAAARFGPQGASTALLVLAILAVWNAVAGRGPFLTLPPAETVLHLQIFLVIAAFPVLALAALVEENTDLARRLVIESRSADRRRAEALEAARRAQRADQAKSRFLAAASHDLRQPLQAQVLFHALLAQQNTDPKVAPIIAKMGQTIAAQQQMLNTLLDISRLDAGIVDVVKTDFPVRLVLDRLVQEFDMQAAKQGLDLRMVAGSAWVHSDPHLLERMLRNLLANAIKYTEHGRILVGYRHDGSGLRLQVWDTGIGIPPDQLTAIFEEFHQLGNPARDRSQGLGLGLAIVDRLAKLLGYRIKVCSVMGRGSLFEIAGVPLACTPPFQPSVKRQLDVSVSRGNGPVAVVEDDGEVLEALQLLLGAIGYQVAAGSTIAEAVAHCHRQPCPPRVIVADFRLRQGESGTEAIERLRSEFGATIPGILLTGETSPEWLKAVKVRGLEVLHKPIEPGTLIAAIEQALDQSG